VDADLARHRAKLLAERRALLETRLAYQALVDALRLRDKVFIDAADAPGRRHLFLLDPDLLRLPPAVGPPKEREP
jgi:Cu+-exporting ATPase